MSFPLWVLVLQQMEDLLIDDCGAAVVKDERK